MTYSRIRFRNGDAATRRRIIMTLGQNFTLKNQKISLNTSEWLVPIANHYPAIEAEDLRRAGTNKNASPKVKEEALMLVSDSWRARWDSNPRHSA